MGIKNGGATCYMNSLFQQLFMQPSIREFVLAGAEVPPADRRDCVFYQLQVRRGQAMPTISLRAASRFGAKVKRARGHFSPGLPQTYSLACSAVVVLMLEAPVQSNQVRSFIPATLEPLDADACCARPIGLQ